jgi:streptogramin lyase
MTRFGIMLAAAIAIMVAAGGGAVYAKMAMQTFPVLAGAGAHDVYPAPDGTVCSPRNPPASSAALTPGPADRI